MFLTCPIRGKLIQKTLDKSGLNFTEEYQRIELVKFLLNKGYPKEWFKFEYKIPYGNKGKNSLIPDLVLEDETKTIFLVAEVKKNSSSEHSALNHQLWPAMKQLLTEYAIYYDGLNNKLFRNQNIEIIYNINKLPKIGLEFNEKKIIFDELQPIKNVSVLYDELELLSHNIGLSKETRYTGIFQILVSKYFDEKFNKNELMFFYNSKFKENFFKLFYKAFDYYKNDINNFNKTEVILEKNLDKIILLLQNFSFLKSDLSVIQSFFMKFALVYLKKDLAQFYTPIQIIKFISSLLDIKSHQKVIDPAGGTGDFLIGIINKYKIEIENYKNNIHYWDISKDVLQAAKLNFIFNGDGRTTSIVIDSIKNFEKSNNEFDFVITNPPFGEKVIWEGDKKILEKYNVNKFLELKAKTKSQELGILFVERSMNLLKENGLLTIILPSGYMNNSTKAGFRKWILENYQLISCISMPEGIFKGANTGVKTEIVIIKKSKNITNYPIFMAVAKKVGFDFKTAKLPIIYLLNKITGEEILDDDNEKIIDSDLEIISKKLKKFAFDNSIDNLEKNNSNIEYDFLYKDDLLKDKFLVVKPEFYLNSFQKIFNKPNLKSLKNFQLDNVSIIKTTKSFLKQKSKIYKYIAISDGLKGDYSLENKLYGWQLPTRAKIIPSQNDIFISYLLGSYNKFFIFLNENIEKDIVVTNGFIRIRINDEKIRLSFLSFLYTDLFKKQFEAFSSGQIQCNITPEKVWDFKFEILTDDELNEWKQIINAQMKLKKRMDAILTKSPLSTF